MRPLVVSAALLATAAISLPALATAPEPFYLTPVPDEATRMRVYDPDGRQHELYTQSHALLIGEVKYEHWNALPAVRQEILELAKVLERHRFKVQVHFDLRSEEFVPVVDKFMRHRGAVPESRILIYVSGHGWKRSPTARPVGYVVPVDAPPEDGDKQALTSSAIAMPLFAAWAQAPDPRHMLFIFDACFSGSFFGRPDPAPAPGPLSGPSPLHALPNATREATPVNLPPKDYGIERSDHIFQDAPRDYGRQFLTAGSQNEIAPPDSIFTRLLIEILSGDRAQEASHNADHWTTGTELGHWLVANTRRSYRGKEQNLATPVFGSLRDEFYENGDIVFARLDIPDSRVLAEERWPSLPTMAALQPPTMAAREAAERKAQESAMAAAASAELADSKRIAADRASAQFGESQEVQAHAAAARMDADVARRRAEQQEAEAAHALDVVAALDAALARVNAVAPLFLEGRLTAGQEAELQALVNNLSSDDTPTRRSARKEIAAFLRGLSPEQQATTTERLLGDLRRKSYRYQLGIAVALADEPALLDSAAKDLIVSEIHAALEAARDKTLRDHLVKLQSLL